MISSRNVDGLTQIERLTVATSANAATINLIDNGGVTGSVAERGFKIAEHALAIYGNCVKPACPHRH